MDEREELANARLIASAPDLLAALEMYLVAFDAGSITNQPSGGLDCAGHIELLARAAIAKAIGANA